MDLDCFRLKHIIMPQVNTSSIPHSAMAIVVTTTISLDSPNSTHGHTLISIKNSTLLTVLQIALFYWKIPVLNSYTAEPLAIYPGPPNLIYKPSTAIN